MKIPDSQASQWHVDIQSVLVAAIETVRLRLLGEPNGDAFTAWQKAEKDLAGYSTLRRLTDLFQLTAFEEQVIILCAGAVLEPRLAAACARQGRNPRLTYPTFRLALSALPNAHWSATAPNAALRYWRLIHLDDEDQFLQAPIRLDERILHYLMGLQAFPHGLDGLVERIPEPEVLSPSQAATVSQIVNIHERALPGNVPVPILRSSDPASCRTCAAAAYHRLGLGVLTLDANDLPVAIRERTRLARLLERETLLSNAALYLDAHELQEAQQPAAVAFANRFQGLLTIGQRYALDGLRKPSVPLDVARPTASEQEQAWLSALGPLAQSLNGSIPRLVRQFDLNTTLIQTLGMRLQSQPWDGAGGAGSDGGDLADAVEDRLWQLCSVQSRPQLDSLAQRIESRATWDALVLPDPQHGILREIIIHVRGRYQVYYEWGFAHLHNRGLGISALFSGDSGTGKTLAAEVVANQLRLDLYRIDLSSVVSKYIGETEKNLARVFDAAESSGAVLLFDEADALFGKRTEVKDAHDRYANIEVSYLLQRMEAYRGLAILTTNFKRNLDPAFLRRLRFIVQFPFPGSSERRRIWGRIFPPNTPVDGLDYDRLAQLNVSGGHIKNIAVHAAFLAVHDQQPVTMDHILRAAQGEYRKIDKPLTSSEIRGWVS